MAVEAQFYPENLGLPSLPMCAFQDWMPIPAALPDFVSSTTLQQQPSQKLLPFHHLQQKPQDLVSAPSSSSPSSSSSTCNSFLPMPLSQSLDALLEVQSRELDCILHLQNERLKYVLRDQRKRQLATVLKCMESKASYLIRQKDEDLARATRKTLELEACLRKAEMETESWERLAKANEAMVLDLSNTLEQFNRINNTAEDAESLCRDDDQHEEEMICRKIACKHCNTRVSCVVFLPCRHLCSCIPCEAFLDSCPVCKSVKKGSMDVFWV